MGVGCRVPQDRSPDDKDHGMFKCTKGSPMLALCLKMPECSNGDAGLEAAYWACSEGYRG